jgi:hypothetical protein
MEESLVQRIIDWLTGWMPGWAQHTSEILIYLAILGAIGSLPLLLWLGAVVALPSRKRTTSST